MFALLLTGFIAFGVSGARAQGVSGGTQISNRVSVTYTEPDGGTVSTLSNTVTVTVTNVTGLAITPDAGTPPGVNGGDTNVVRTFVLSNTGNITESVQFGAGGASLIKTGPVTVTAAFVDADGNGTFSAGDVDILTSTGPLSMAMQTSVNVIVRFDVSPAAPQGSAVTLQLGDAAGGAPNYDNQPADNSAGSVKTVGSTGVNGDLEARGNMAFTVISTGNVLIGPLGHPDAVGPTNNMDDYTNKTLTAGIDVPFGGTTTAGGALVFTNTVKNMANADDQITVSTVSAPAGFTVEVSADGTTYGSTASVVVPTGGTRNVFVRVTAPSGISVLSGYSSTLRATSGITPQNNNETIDRLFTGFIRADKSVSVSNTTGVGGPTDAVPGALVTYTVTYSNVTASAGTNNADLTATNVVLTEDGNAAPNNWATTTNHVAGSSLLTDTVPSLAPSQSGTFVFKRVVR